MLEWCYSSTSPAHLQHTSSTFQHAAPSELLERVGSVPTPLQHHTSTTSTRLRVTLGAAHKTSRDPKVKIRFGNRAKTRFQAGFAILTSFSKANSSFFGRFSFDSHGFGDRWRRSQSSELLERVGWGWRCAGGVLEWCCSSTSPACSSVVLTPAPASTLHPEPSDR